MSLPAAVFLLGLAASNGGMPEVDWEGLTNAELIERLPTFETGTIHPGRPHELDLASTELNRRLWEGHVLTDAEWRAAFDRVGYLNLRAPGRAPLSLVFGNLLEPSWVRNFGVRVRPRVSPPLDFERELGVHDYGCLGRDARQVSYSLVTLVPLECEEIEFEVVVEKCVDPVPRRFPREWESLWEGILKRPVVRYESLDELLPPKEDPELVELVRESASLGPYPYGAPRSEWSPFVFMEFDLELEKAPLRTALALRCEVLKHGEVVETVELLVGRWYDLRRDEDTGRVVVPHRGAAELTSLTIDDLEDPLELLRYELRITGVPIGEASSD